MTLYIIGVTCLVSILAFNNREMMDKLSLKPWLVLQRNEYWRILSHGLIHADYIHLFVNMFVLYSFGSFLEMQFEALEQSGIIKNAAFTYLFFYISGIAAATLLTISKYRNDQWYSAVGASGAVSAMVFISIFFNPWQKLYFFGVLPIPGIIFGGLYLYYSHYMSRKNTDNIAHEAHFLGAVYGMVFPLFLEPKLIFYFINQLTNVQF